MRLWFVVLASLVLASGVAPVRAQTTPEIPKVEGVYTIDELEEILGPIALFPDPLLATVLAASVYPDQVAEAAKAVAAGEDAAAREARGWESPVTAIANVPDAIAMLGDYPEWTEAIGRAYLTQQQDVMDTIQKLRSIANDNGALVTTPQQTVIIERDVIVIQPANPDVIFVPVYTPSVVFVRDRRPAPGVAVVSFGVGVAVGAIIANNNCSWGWRGGVVWGPSWRHNTRINNNVNININNNNNNNVNINRPGGTRPGQEGSPWRPNPDRVPPNLTRPSDRPGRPSGIGIPGRDIPGRDPSRPGGGSRPPDLNLGDRPNRPGGIGGTRPPDINPGDRPNRPGGIGGSRPPDRPMPDSISRPGGTRPNIPQRPEGRPIERPAAPPPNLPGRSPNASRPTTPSVTRPTTPSVTRPTTPSVSRPTTPSTQPTARPTPPPTARPGVTRPAANNSGAFSPGGMNNAAVQRGAASRAGNVNRPAPARTAPTRAGGAGVRR